MSWSFQALGKPEAVIRALEAHGGKLDGDCKLEFDAAMPHLRELVRQNFGLEGQPPNVRIEASGSGYSRDGTQVSRQCTVRIEPTYIQILTDP